jgi:hypothetical protein
MSLNSVVNVPNGVVNVPKASLHPLLLKAHRASKSSLEALEVLEAHLQSLNLKIKGKNIK